MSEIASTAKLAAMELVSSLPEDSSFDDIQYHLYLLQKVRRGIEDADAGLVCTPEEARQRLARWLD